MKKNSITRIKAIFLLAAVFLVTLSILSFIRIKKLIEVSQWVNHTHVVKLNLESTFSSLLDMETSQRGYLLTRDTMFLKAYYRKGNILTQRLSLLDSVTRDNIIQHINIVELKNFTEKRRIFLQEVLDSSNNGRIPVQKIVKGKTLMRNIRDQINKM